MTGGPEVRAVVEEVEAGEASRRRRHAVLLEDLADDAAATARVLADACAAVGGRGTRGDANRVIAYLAAELPGWGDLELARPGRALADGFAARPVTSGAGRARARGAPFRGLPVLRGRAARWPRARRACVDLWSLGDGDSARTARRRGCWRPLWVPPCPSGPLGDPVAEVLEAEYVRTD